MAKPTSPTNLSASDPAAGTLSTARELLQLQRQARRQALSEEV